MAAVGLKGSLALSVFCYLIWTVIAAPVEEGTSHALQISDSIGEVRGCYYNFEHYGEGDRILTNEPCLNCTCHNRMLMCYLRVCPFTKAIGQDCTFEKKPDQCCPVITCPQVPVALLTSSTTSEAPQTTTALGRLDNYGCLLEDNTFYADGAQVPSDPSKPCELCYCIRNHTACVMQECTLNVEGCKPVYQEGVCCPVRYDCDYDDVATTPKPTIGLVTTPGGPSDCLHNGHIYRDGAMVMKDEKAACKHCYCMRGEIVCAVQECGTPLEGTNCIPMEPKPGQCCPNYECTNGTYSTENYFNALSSSTETFPEAPVTELIKHEKPDSDESSNETTSNESSEESKKEGSGAEVSKPEPELTSSHNAQETSSTTPEQTEVSDDSSASSSDEHHTKQPDTNELVTSETPVHETINGQVGDSISEATHDLDVTHPHEVPHNLGDQENTSVEQEDETTQKQEVIPEQEVSNGQEATNEEEKVTQVPESTHKQEATHEQEPIHTVDETTHAQEQIHDQEVTQETPVSEDKDETHKQNTNEHEVTPSQEEATHAPDVTHEKETPVVQEANQEQDVTHVQEEATHAPDVIHEQDNSNVQEATQEQDATRVKEEVTQLPEVTQEEDSPVVHQEATHEQDATHSVEEVSQVPEATHAPQVIHEQETSNVQEANQEQEVTHKHDAILEQDVANVHETTNVQEGNVEQTTVKQEIQTQATIEIVKDPQVTNEIPESTPHEQSEPSTEEPVVEVARVPGEGSCLVDGKTYAHNSIISSENPCHEECRCYSSIVTCKTKECTPPPTQYEHCEPVITPGSCCPTYMCDQKPSDAPEAHSQLSDHTGDAAHSDASDEITSDNVGTTQASIETEHKESTIAPVVEGIPSDNLHPGSDEAAVPAGQPEETHHEPAVQTTEQTGSPADISSSNISEDENVNSQVVHGVDAAIHGGHPEALDNKLETGNRPHPSEDTTVVPIVPEKPAEETQETGASQEPETSNAEHTEETPVKQEDESVTSSDDGSTNAPLDITSSPKPNDEESSPSQETAVVGSEDSQKIHQEIQETTVNYVPEVTTVHQGSHTDDSVVPSADNVEAEENNNDVTSNDSTIDESKHEESIVTIKPTEINLPQESEGANTEHYYLPTEGPVGIPDQSHSQYDDDPEQIHHAILFQQTTESESLPETSTETIAVSGDPSVPSVSNEVPDENQNIAMEANVPSETEIPHKHDSDAEANQVSSVSVESEEKVVTSLPEVAGDVSYETTSKPIFEEAPSSSSPDEKVTESSLNQVSGEAHDETNHSIEDTTDSVVHTTIKQEILPNVETSQDENKAQDSNNIISSSTEDEKPGDITTLPPIVNKDVNTDEKLENVIPHETQEQTSEENIHSDEVINHPEPVQPEEAHSEEKPTQETNEHVAVEHVSHETSSETSTEEVKAEESDSNKPAEVTDIPVHNVEHDVHSDSSPEVIFEEVTVTEMPSIESHVTEGTADHSVNLINNILEDNTVHTTEHTEPAIDPSLSNEVKPSNEPVNSEAPYEPIVETEKTIVEQPAEDITASPQPDQQNVEESHHETTSSHQETSSSESQNEATTQKSNVEESHQEVVNQDSVGSNEAVPTQFSPSEQTTLNPIAQDSNDNLNQVISEEITTAPNEEADTIPQEQPNSEQNPASDDQKNEEAPLQEVSHGASGETAQPISEINAEQANVVSETTALPSAETMPPVIQQETNVDENVDANAVNQPHTDAPLEDEKVNVGETDHIPHEEVQTDQEEASHVEHEEPSLVSHEPSEIIPTTEKSFVTNPPSQPVHETSQDVIQTESSPEPNQNEVVQQETTETPVQNQSENISEGNSPANESVDTVKETGAESEQVQTEPPTESPEVPSSDNIEHSHEVSNEHIIEPQPEQNATPSSPSADLESSTAHETVVSQTENILSSSPGGSNDILQSSGGSEDSTTQTPQVTHLEDAVPPAPDSDSHVLETNENEAESVTPAGEQSTAAGESTVSDNNQHNIEESHHEVIPQSPAETEPEHPIVNEPVPEDNVVPTTHTPELAETSPGFVNHESSTVHPDTHPDVSPSFEPTHEDVPSSTEHPLTQEVQTTPKEVVPETQKIETEKPAENVPVTESIPTINPLISDKIEEHVGSEQPDDQSSKVPITPSTEAAPLIEIPSSTYKPSIVHHEESPSFPTWSQKPFEHHTTPEPHPPEENHYPSGFDPEYEDEEGVSYGPGTCRYGGKVYLSAQQIPRDDPCDFCFCFRSDIICLQQSCPPPIRGCYQETIKGFCCPRYECHVSMATMLNMTTTTTTTTTTLPPHFLSHAYNGAATKAGCQVKDVAYSVGERIPSTSGPCLECRCGANGQMKCDPTVCGPQEALLRQVMDAAVSRRR